MKSCMSDERIELFARSIKERLGDRLVRVVLFGSRARGDARDDSDYDCLIVIREITREVKDVIDEAAGEALLQTGAVISAFPITERAAESTPFSPLLISVRNEGVAI
ncbi:MAG: nucleotidyltransferase domain-containing protein [Kiritimatiellia bacterium]|nr:nucleotidyltransferase domain-containing protein [Kiritimatiellia bacterium]